MSSSSYDVVVKRLEERYNSHSERGIKNYLGDVHKLRAARFVGSDTTYISNFIVDYERLFNEINLTERQSECLYLFSEKDLSESQISEILGISQQMVNVHISSVVKKVMKKSKELCYE